MKNVKYLLIGGGLASCEAVKGIRKHDGDGEIALVGQEAHHPYNRPPLSKAFLQGKKSANECLCEEPSFYEQNGVELFLGRRVKALDANAHRINLDNGEEVEFEKALLATGGEPVRPPIEGLGLGNVFFLRTLDDSMALQSATRVHREAVVIGAGFIGMEVAASLTAMGVQVTVVETQDRLWPRFADPKLGACLADYYREKGIETLTGEKVEQILGPGEAQSVVLESGRELKCGFVVCAVGIKPNVELAEQAGLDVDNGVVTNAKLQTSHPDVYAAGDILNYPDPYFNKRRRVEHWGQAEYTGNLAGANMTGEGAEYDLLTYVWSEAFDLHYEFAGEEGVYDETILRGKFPENNFAALYLVEHRLRGFVAVNPAKEIHKSLEKLVESQRDLSGREEALAHLDCDLTKL